MILKHPNEKLKKVSTEVADFNQVSAITDELIRQIKKVDHFFNFWLGMAAPQIGFNKRVILIKISRGNYKVMINPKIIKRSFSLPLPSKCYSVSGLYIVNNPLWLKVKYQDSNGIFHQEVFKGGKSVVLQQEVDHINGILICDRGLRIL